MRVQRESLTHRRRRGPLPWCALSALLLLSVGCGDEGDDTDSSPGGGSGATGGLGTLGTGGNGYGAGTGGGSGTAGMTSGGSTANPGGTGGAGSPAGGGTSTGTGGAGSPAGGGTSTGTGGSTTLTDCAPLDMEDWQPPAYRPPRHAEVCSESAIGEYYDRCLFGSDCSAFEAGGEQADCGACLAPSNLDDSVRGPLLLAQPPPFYVYESNVGGCIDLLGYAECGAKIQAADACAHAACGEPCTEDGMLAFEAYQRCTAKARETVCSAYQAAAVCIVDQTLANTCSGSGFRALFSALGTVFCGEG